MSLDPTERRTLLRIARDAIRERLLSDGSLTRQLSALHPTPGIQRRCGAFVTLRKRGSAGKAELRGCIGLLAAESPLYRTVADLAPRAACHDPRFPPLEPDELPLTTIGISVLEPAVALTDPAGLVIGRDGVQLVRGGKRSVFLPEVALEHGWSWETLLRNLARKAGLDEAEWKGAELWRFGSEKFDES